MRVCEISNEKDEELVWRRFMNLLNERMNERHGEERGLFIQIDYSATPFFGSKEKKEYFPHIVYDYDLLKAMHDMLVKQIFLEERQKVAGEDLATLDFRAVRAEPEGGHKRGEVIELSEGQKILLQIGKSKLEQLAVEFRGKGINKKPVLLILAENTKVADLVRDHFYTLTDEHGLPYDDSQVMLIHSDLPEKELEEARQRLDLIDDNDNPLRVVVSVLMLREGFDKKNICVTVVLRATEADLLLEQIVGRGLRLMFPKWENPEFYEAKREAYWEIRSNKTPSNSLDFLFIVEHPGFREFYEKLKEEGYAIGIGDTSTRSSTGDLIPVDAIADRIPRFDIGWPVQVFDSAEKIDLSKIKPEELPRYPGEFSSLKKLVSGIKITDTHMGTGKKVKTWELPNEYFDFAFFLRSMTNAVVLEGKKPILSGMKAEVAGLIDEYVSKYCFGQEIDFSKEENYRILNYSPVFDHIKKALRQAILALSGEIVYEHHGRWGRLSDVPRLMIRESKSVPSEKCIYPLVGYQPKGGGFERGFMLEILEPSFEVLAYSKLDRKHNLKIPYRDEIGVLRNYEVDFIVKTNEKMYLVETKADRDLKRPEVAVKIRAAMAWCEQASTVKLPDNLHQPNEWEYLVISEGFFKQNRGLSFGAFKDAARLLREQLVARYERRLL
ncbi:MAG: hypothetical protein ABIM74_05905 [candidate division WOR-3 bacterium]